MVFSINATPLKPYDQFLAAAKASNASVPNPQTLGAATDPSQNGTIAQGPDTNAPSSSSTPNGTPAVSGSGTGTDAAPAQSSGAALPNMRAPSLAIGALAVVLGAAL